MRDFEAGVWAVVSDAGGKRYIGCLSGVDHAETAVDRFRKCEALLLEDAWSYIEMDLPVSGPEGLGVQHMVHCRPINNCEGPTTIWVIAHTLHLFDDMEESDRRRNKVLVEQVTAAALQARAKRSGLTLVGPGGGPGGPHGPRRSS